MRRGEIRWADLGEGQPRPVLAVHADPLAAASTVIVLPLVDTAQTAGPPLVLQLSASVTGLPSNSSIKVDLIRTLPAVCVGELVTRLRDDELSYIDDALREVLGLGS